MVLDCKHRIWSFLEHVQSDLPRFPLFKIFIVVFKFGASSGAAIFDKCNVMCASTNRLIAYIQCKRLNSRIIKGLRMVQDCMKIISHNCKSPE